MTPIVHEVGLWIGTRMIEGVTRIELWRLAQPQTFAHAWSIWPEMKAKELVTIAEMIRLGAELPVVDAVALVGHGLFAYRPGEQEAAALALLREGQFHPAHGDGDAPDDPMFAWVLRESERVARMQRMTARERGVEIPPLDASRPTMGGKRAEPKGPKNKRT